MTAPGAAIDVGDPDFEREVLERSRQVPVVVDFWAPWCAPCRALGPILERLAVEHAGDFVLTKVDVDAAPGVAQRYGVRSIPLVLGFRGGEVVAEFAGAQPEPAVRRFLAQVLPTPADELADEADLLAESKDAPGAEERYRAALELEPRHGRALLGLARVLASGERTEEAHELLQRIVPSGSIAAEADRLAAELRTRGAGSAQQGAEADLRARLAGDDTDLAARLELGRLLAAGARHEEALTELLAVVKRDPGFDEQAARKAMLDLFEVIGPEAELTKRFRSELARALFR